MHVNGTWADVLQQAARSFEERSSSALVIDRQNEARTFTHAQACTATHACATLLGWTLARMYAVSRGIDGFRAQLGIRSGLSAVWHTLGASIMPPLLLCPHSKASQANGGCEAYTRRVEQSFFYHCCNDAKVFAEGSHVNFVDGR